MVLDVLGAIFLNNSYMSCFKYINAMMSLIVI